MSQDEIITRLLAMRDDAEVTRYLESIKTELSLDTTLALRKTATKLCATDPHLALLASDRAKQVSNFVNDEMAVIHALCARSNALLTLASYDELYEVNQEIIDRATPLEDWRLIAGAYRGQMKPLSVAGRIPEALEAGEKAIEACAKGGPSCDDALVSIATSMASVHSYLGNYEAAFQVAHKAYEDAVQIHINIETALLGTIGSMLYELDRYDESKHYLQLAYERAVEAGNTRNQGLTLFRLGELTLRMGDYQQGLDYLERSREFAGQLELRESLASIDAACASVYLELNLLEEAARLSADALDSFVETEQDFRQSELLLLQGAALRRSERYEEATDALTKARHSAETTQREHLLALIQYELGYVSYLSDKVDEALAMIDNVQSYAHLANSPTLHANVMVLSARCWLAVGDEHSAETDLNLASELERQFNLPNIAIQVSYLHGLLHQQRNRPNAYAELEQSVTKITERTANLALDELRIGYLSDKAEIFAACIDAAHQSVEAAQISLGKLLNAVNLTLTAPLGRLAAASFGQLSDADQTRLDALRVQWNWYQAKLDQVGFASSFRGSAEPIEEDLDTYGKLREIEIEIADLMRRQRIRASAGRSTDESAQSDSAELLTALQQQLGSDQALVQFYIAQGQCQALVVTAEQIELFPNLTDAVTLNQLLQTWRFHIESVVPMQAEPSLPLTQLYLSKLYDSLCRSTLAGLANYRQLMLVLPTEWHDLPVAALYDGQSYLIERFEISHLSTPQALLHDATSVAEQLEQRALVVGYSDAGRLPNTLQESFAVCQELPSGWQMTHVTEEDATATHFREHCQEASLIHLATHATFRPDNPLFSWLRFADKHITVVDMYDMQLKRRPLVVLSACQTGSGKAQGGGVLGMGRGLLAAGASQVVLSRWQLEDAASAELMQHFYQHYDPDKQNVAQALQQAQIAALHNHPHPFLWASYMHIQG